MSVYILKNEVADQAEYLSEMLELWGGAFAQIVETRDLPLLKDAEVILVPLGVAIEKDILSALPALCKHLIFVAPKDDILRAMGMTCFLPYSDDAKVSWLRLSTPLLGGYSHYSLPVVGRRVQGFPENINGSLPKELNVLAWLYETGNQVTDRPAIWNTLVQGACVTVIAYDLVECYRNLRQGFPQFADWRPGIDVHARPCDLFGPEWEQECPSQHLPLADFHPMLLLELIEQALDRPMVRFWQLPGNSRSVILISGDEDNADPACNESICSFLDSLGATMTTYIQMDGTKTTLDQMQEWMKRGHRFSVHPFPKTLEDADSVPRGDVLEKIEACFTEFQERYHLPTRTVRNHRLYWTGYDEIPKLWEKLGVQMDCNYGYNFRFRGISSFFISPAASLPISFMDRHFKRLNVYQQPCHLGDDTCFNPEGFHSRKISPELFEAYAETLITQVLEPTGTPFAVCFHPVNYVRFAREAEERFLIRAKSLGAKMICDEAWLDFWQMRSGWRLVNQRQDGNVFSCQLQSERPSRDLSIMLPISFKEMQIDQVTLNGQECRPEEISHFGRKRLLIPIPEGMKDCQLNVTIK